MAFSSIPFAAAPFSSSVIATPEPPPVVENDETVAFIVYINTVESVSASVDQLVAYNINVEKDSATDVSVDQLDSYTAYVNTLEEFVG